MCVFPYKGIIELYLYQFGICITLNLHNTKEKTYYKKFFRYPLCLPVCGDNGKMCKPTARACVRNVSELWQFKKILKTSKGIFYNVAEEKPRAGVTYLVEFFELRGKYYFILFF